MFSRLAVLILLLVAACGGDSLAGFGEPCRGADQCADGLCVAPGGFGEATCTSECDGDGDCAAGAACGTLTDGSRVCLAGCTDSGATIVGFGCVDGAQVACALAIGDAPCGQCGCPSGSYCPTEGGGSSCLPLADQGEACLGNADCASGNCSTHAASAAEPGTCMKAHGSACTRGDGSCLSCDVTAAGTVCARGCGGADGCGGGEECIGSDRDGYFCRPDCYASRRCPAYWTCELVSEFNMVAYCEPPDSCDPNGSVPCGFTRTCHPDLRICY